MGLLFNKPADVAGSALPAIFIGTFGKLARCLYPLGAVLMLAKSPLVVFCSGMVLWSWGVSHGC